MTTAAVVDVGRLRRVQAGARATLALGIGASLTANMLAAHPSLIGRLVAGWSPLALMLTVELLSRVPTSTSRLSRLRVVAAGAIAAIAAWVSYWHMVSVSLDAGEAPIAAHLLPLSVDGLVVVASICLVEITNRLNTTTSTAPAARRPVDRGARLKATPPSEQPPTSRPAPPRAQSVNGAGSAVGERVRQLAAQHPGWTQAELAEAAGCSIRTVRRHLTAPTPSAATAEAAGPVVELVDAVNGNHDRSHP